MLIPKKLLIVALALSVNFSYHAHAMNTSPVKRKTRAMVYFPKVQRKLFYCDDQAQQNDRDFLEAVYARNTTVVNELMSPTSLAYLFHNFSADCNVARDIIFWAHYHGLTEIIKRIETVDSSLMELSDDDFWQDWDL